MRIVAEACMLFLIALWLAAAAGQADGAERRVYTAVMIAWGDDGWSRAATLAWGDSPEKCEEQARAFIAKYGPADHACEAIPYTEFRKAVDWLQYLKDHGRTVRFQQAR